MTEIDAQTTPQPGSREALISNIDALRTELQGRLKDPIKVQKALDTLKKKGGVPTGEALEKPLRDLRKANLETVGLNQEREALVQEFDRYIERHKMKLRMSFLGELNQLAAAQEVDLVKVSETPPAFYLAPLTVELDFDSERAVFLFAREVVDETPLTAKSVLEGRKKGAEKIRKQALESDDFFELLNQAYQLVLLARGETPGARVDLVDLLVPLAVLRSGHEGWRKKGLGGLDEYPRYLLAYQLHRLRRDGLLEKDGRRIDLGTATGGTTKNKKDVLFIPSAATEGQYYLSIRIGS